MLGGRLTRDPEVRYTPKGTATATITLATNRTYKVGEETKEEVTFIDVETWGRTSESIGEYLKKGSTVVVEGRLKLDQWDDKESGQKRSKLKVVAEFVHFGEKRSDGGSRDSAPQGASRPAGKPAQDSAPSGGEGDDNIPF